MSLDARRIYDKPFLLPDDVLMLHADIRLSRTSLVDIPLMAVHHIDKQAFDLLCMVQHGISFQQLQQAANHRAIDTLQLAELLGLLNEWGVLIIRRRSWNQYIASSKVWAIARFSGIRFGRRHYRYTADLAGIFVATCHACVPVAAGALIVGSLLAVSQTVHYTSLLLLGGYFIGLLVASVVLHELTHLLWLRRNSIATIVLRQGMRIGVAHRTTRRVTTVVTAVVGPLAGTAVCVICLVASRYTSPYLDWISCGVAMTHIGALLPWYGDGKQLIHALRLQERTS